MKNDLFLTHPGVYLAHAEIFGHYATTDQWGKLCELSIREAAKSGLLASYISKYKAARKISKQAMADALELDMLDNYILAAFAAKEMNLPRSMPLIPWAACNKSFYGGLGDEISLVRTLIWAGFDINAQSESGSTALHYFSQMQHGSGCFPRALELLLDMGANPNIQNMYGDTPLIKVAAFSHWHPDHTMALNTLLEHGANSSIIAKDGHTAHSVMSSQQAINPNPDRQVLMEALESLGSDG